jgi:uncharacterized protein (TIGR01777 family)
MDAVRIVVTGGTGFIGRSLVRSLSERGDDVVVLSRGHDTLCPGPRAGCMRGSGKVELATWTPEQGGDWQRVVDGADAVIHLAGASVLDGRWTPEFKKVLRSSRIASTKLLAEAIARAEKKPRVFVSGSAVGYYGTSTGDRVLSESDPPGDDFLATLVRDWEDAAKGAGVRICHPRIGIVLGHRGGALAKMLPFYRAFVGGPVGDGKQYIPWIHMADTVGALEYAIANESVVGPFDVTAPDPVTMNDFSHALAKAVGRPAPFRVPAFAVKLAMGEAAVAVLTGQRAIPKKLVETGFAFVFPELASALADLLSPTPARVVH